MSTDRAFKLALHPQVIKAPAMNFMATLQLDKKLVKQKSLGADRANVLASCVCSNLKMINVRWVVDKVQE